MNTAASSGTGTRPDAAGRGDVAAGLPLRAAQPPGQQPCRLRGRSPGFQQDCGLVDVRRVLRGTRAAISRHDTKILQIMSSGGQKPSSCSMISLTGPVPPPAPARSSDAIVSAVDVSSPDSQPTIRRSQAPSSIAVQHARQERQPLLPGQEPARIGFQRPRRHHGAHRPRSSRR